MTQSSINGKYCWGSIRRVGHVDFSASEAQDKFPSAGNLAECVAFRNKTNVGDVNFEAAHDSHFEIHRIFCGSVCCRIEIISYANMFFHLALGFN